MNPGTVLDLLVGKPLSQLSWTYPSVLVLGFGALSPHHSEPLRKKSLLEADWELDTGGSPWSLVDDMGSTVAAADSFKANVEATVAKLIGSELEGYDFSNDTHDLKLVFSNEWRLRLQPSVGEDPAGKAYPDVEHWSLAVPRGASTDLGLAAGFHLVIGPRARQVSVGSRYFDE